MRRIPTILWVLIALLTIVNCAKRGSPTGGPKDEDPPKLTGAEPTLFSTQFDGKKIRITFDEYVKLKDLQKQLIISPPLDPGAYNVTPQGAASKYIDIKITDTLQENTTYTFNFGQSIVDNNEDNPYEYFKYVFSTGDYIDSLSVRGMVKDALNRNPDQFVSVMLYRVDSTYTDSIIYKQKPTYITNTLDSVTTFDISNVNEGKYLLVAIRDEATNFRFDQNTDKIGYHKEFITLPTDSLYELTMFKEAVNFEFGRPSHAAGNRITFGHTGDPEGMAVELISPKPDNYEAILLKDPSKDSLNYWFKPFEADSLLFKVSKDTLSKAYTLKLRKLPEDSLQISLNQPRTLSLHEKLYIVGNTPITTIRKEMMSLIDKDSTAIDFNAVLDEEKNQVLVDFQPKYSQRYQLRLLPEAIKDLYGTVNDTLLFGLSTKSPSDLGNMQLQLVNVNFYPIIIQVTNDKGDVIREEYVTEARPEYIFDGIEPGKYYIRIVDDANKNGKWDTGNFLKRTQPERVRYHQGVIDLRANWELNETFTLQD